MPNSVNTYSRIISKLIDRYGPNPTLEQLNEFIQDKCNKRQPKVKYAIKHYLDFTWRQNVYHQLVKAKVKPIKIRKNYLSREEALAIMQAITHPDYRAIAKIQYFTGARPSETISILKKDVKHELEENRVRINIRGKGDKIGSLYLDDSIWLDLKPLTISESPYLFLRFLKEELSDYELAQKVENYYKRYHKNLKEAADKCDIEISPHDWRRSFAQSLKDEGSDIVEIKKALRHSNISTTERYFDDDQKTIAKTMLKHQNTV